MTGSMRTFVTDRQTDGRSWLHRARGAGPEREGGEGKEKHRRNLTEWWSTANKSLDISSFRDGIDTLETLFAAQDSWNKEMTTVSFISQ